MSNVDSPMSELTRGAPMRHKTALSARASSPKHKKAAAAAKHNAASRDAGSASKSKHTHTSLPKGKRRAGAAAAPWISRELKIAVVCGVALLLLCLWLPTGDYVRAILQFIDDLPLVPSLVIFTVLYIVVTVILLPAMFLSVAAGYLYGLWIGSAVTLIGATVGAMLSFVLGQRLLRATATRMVQKWPRFGAVDRAMSQQAFKLVVLLRISPLTPYNVMNMAMGLTCIDFWTYSWASFLGMIPQQVVLVYTGTATKSLTDVSGADAMMTSSHAYVYAGIGITAVVAVLITYIVNKELGKVLEKKAIQEV